VLTSTILQTQWHVHIPAEPRSPAMVILISATALHALIPLAVETRYNHPTG